jgi:hypothetical protein
MEASAFRWSELFMAEADGKTPHPNLQPETVIAKTALQIRCQRKIRGISSPQTPPAIHLPMKRTEPRLFWIKSKHLFVLASPLE